MASSESSSKNSVDYRLVIDGLRQRQQGSMEELYRLLNRRPRAYLRSHRIVPDDEIDDVLHDSLIVVIEQLDRRSLNTPSLFPEFLFTIVRRTAAMHRLMSPQLGQAERHHSLDGIDRVTVGSIESALIRKERLTCFQQMLPFLRRVERAVLSRSSLGETDGEIGGALRLSVKQVCQIRWVAKGAVSERLRKRERLGRLKVHFDTARKRLRAPSR